MTDLENNTWTTAVLMIPLVKLQHSAANVRHTDKRAEIESLAEDIAAHGVLQNLNVIDCGNGKFAVGAGGRRFAALKLLLKAGRITKDYLVPCKIVPDEHAVEFSLAENIQRVAMHPMDEMEAFVVLVDGGMSVEAVASRFGAGVRHVEQRLALGRLSPKLRQAYRREEITLDVARAFCLTDDHATQERLFKQFPKPITHAAGVRNALAQGRVPANDKLALFVGLESYEAAGGRVIHDLFDTDVAYLDDAELLQRLAGARADEMRAQLDAEGWGWTEVQFGYGQIEGCASERLQRTQRTLSKRERADLKAYAAEIDDIDEKLEAEDGDDELWAQRDAAEAKLDALRDAVSAFDREQMALAGALIAIDRNGEPVITRGLIKRSDLKAIHKLRKASETNSQGDDDSSEVSLPSAPRLPKTLVQDLTKARTRALRAELSNAPHIALALAVHVLRERSARKSSVAGVDIVSQAIGYEDEDRFERARTALYAEIPERHPLQQLIAGSAEQLTGMLAVFVAETLDFSHQGAAPHDFNLQAVSNILAAALDLDMHKHWEASVEFWERAPKSYILDALAEASPIAEMSEVARKAKLTGLAKLKKPELARHAAKAFRAGDWLPDELITPVPAGALTVTPEGEAALAQAHAA